MLGTGEDFVDRTRLNDATEIHNRNVVGNVLHSYVMDRVFRDEDGARWIADYKTSSHEGGDLDVFLDRERTRYEKQLARYAEALGEKKTKLGLYFPLHAGWREWEN